MVNGVLRSPDNNTVRQHMMNRRDGWNRLGIVLCSAWLIGVLAITAIEHTLPKNGLFVAVSMPAGMGFSKGQLTMADGRTIVLNDQVSDKPWEVDWGAENHAPVSRDLRWRNILYAACFPFLVWLLAFVLAKAIRWVLAGFRGSAA